MSVKLAAQAVQLLLLPTQLAQPEAHARQTAFTSAYSPAAHYARQLPVIESRKGLPAQAAL
jgi:hypothetical protein